MNDRTTQQETAQAPDDASSGDELAETLVGIRHELRTPLNQILGYAELLMDQADDAGDTETSRDLRKIQAAARRLTGIINLLLTDDPPGKLYAAPGTDSTGAGKGVTYAVMTGSKPSISPAISLAVRRTATGAGIAVVAPDLPLLVVDDEPDNREVLTRLLRQMGYTVLEAEDGQEALRILEDTPCDAVFLDMMMPRMNGYQTLQAITADEILRYTPVIMISALDELQVVAHCIEAGAQDYLPKPFNSTILRARLAATLERKRLRDHEQELMVQLAEAYERLHEIDTMRGAMTQDLMGELRVTLTGLQKA